jgi:hypothetical protein
MLMTPFSVAKKGVADMKSTLFASLGLATVLAFAVGCAKPVDTADASGEVHAASHEDDHDHDHAEDGDAHGHALDGWWCAEHGVPEEVCGLCNSKLAAEFQRKGDWCQEHDRPDSQCFVCHPEYEARFAAQYEAKMGKKPPKPAG